VKEFGVRPQDRPPTDRERMMAELASHPLPDDARRAELVVALYRSGSTVDVLAEVSRKGRRQVLADLAANRIVPAREGRRPDGTLAGS